MYGINQSTYSLYWYTVARDRLSAQNTQTACPRLETGCLLYHIESLVRFRVLVVSHGSHKGWELVVS